MSEIRATWQHHPAPLIGGIVLGLLAGIIISAPFKAHTDAGHDVGSRQLNLATLSPADLEQMSLNALALTTERQRAEQPNEPEPELLPSDAHARQVRRRIANARRLLPLAKTLAIESLHQVNEGLDLSRESALIGAVHRLTLDPKLNESAEVWDEDLSTIHIGTEYAVHLGSDDEVMLLLGHELTHVAARTGRLRADIERLAQRIRETAGITASVRQREELACEYVGAETLKRFIASHPTADNNVERFSRAFGYQSRSARLAEVWLEFCHSYYGDPGDHDHLSEQQTLRSLLTFDPSLSMLVRTDAVPPPICGAHPVFNPAVPGGPFLSLLPVFAKRFGI